MAAGAAPRGGPRGGHFDLTEPTEKDVNAFLVARRSLALTSLRPAWRQRACNPVARGAPRKEPASVAMDSPTSGASQGILVYFFLYSPANRGSTYEMILAELLFPQPPRAMA